MKAGDLKNLLPDVPLLADLRVEPADKPIALVPLGAEGWYTEFADIDGRRIELTLMMKK
jgi:hypothetical protein